MLSGLVFRVVAAAIQRLQHGIIGFRATCKGISQAHAKAEHACLVHWAHQRMSCLNSLRPSTWRSLQSRRTSSSVLAWDRASSASAWPSSTSASGTLAGPSTSNLQTAVVVHQELTSSCPADCGPAVTIRTYTIPRVVVQDWCASALPSPSLSFSGCTAEERGKLGKSLGAVLRLPCCCCHLDASLA